jgi:hypothetical protein
VAVLAEVAERVQGKKDLRVRPQVGSADGELRDVHNHWYRTLLHDCHLHTAPPGKEVQD